MVSPRYLLVSGHRSRVRGKSSRARLPVGHPFDLTKTRLQTAAPGTYTGAVDVVKQAVARDGAKGCVCSLSFFSSVLR